MADSVAFQSTTLATPASGTTVATDDTGATGHVQIIKLAISTDGSITYIPADATNGLLVNLGANNDVTVTGTVTAVPGITGIGDGRKVVTTAGTRVALASSTAVKRVIITAETDNTGVIAVGGSAVVASLATRTGVPLNAGDSVEFDIDDLADIWIDSTVSTDGVTYVYFT